MKRKQENKNKFRRIFGVFGILGAMVALVVAGFAPMVSVRAIENQELYAKVMMRGAIGASNEGGNTIFEYDGGTVNVLGLVEPVFEVIDWDYGDGRMGDMYVFYTKGTSAEFVTSPSQGYIPELWINGQMEQLSPEGTYVKNNFLVIQNFIALVVFSYEAGRDYIITGNKGKGLNKIDIINHQLFYLKLI